MSATSFTADRLDRIRGTTANTPPAEAKARKRKKPKPSPFAGLCLLCGHPCKRFYCHAHSWAEGTE